MVKETFDWVAKIPSEKYVRASIVEWGQELIAKNLL